MALWCAIRTFAEHAVELGNEQPPEPVFFVKPNNCIQRSGPIKVSKHPGSVHHEGRMRNQTRRQSSTGGNRCRS